MLADKINSETNNLTENDELKASLEKQIAATQWIQTVAVLQKLFY